jgi:hypothetical protein
MKIEFTFANFRQLLSCYETTSNNPTKIIIVPVILFKILIDLGLFIHDFI